MAECGLAGTGRAGDHNELHSFTGTDHFGDLTDLTLLLRFLYQNHITDISGTNAVI